MSGCVVRRASFLLESVDQGRLGRHSFVGCGTRLVSLAEAERADAPVVGYVGYDHVARLEPTVQLPDDGPPPAREPLRRRRRLPALRSRHRHRRRPARRRRRDRRAARSAGGRRRRAAGRGRCDDPHARPGRARATRQAGAGAHPSRRRVPGRALTTRRATDLRVARSRSIARSAGSTRRRTSSCSSFGDLALVGSSPETHVKVELALAGHPPCPPYAADRLLLLRGTHQRSAQSGPGSQRGLGVGAKGDR